jgi:hypothetical protein
MEMENACYKELIGILITSATGADSTQEKGVPLYFVIAEGFIGNIEVVEAFVIYIFNFFTFSANNMMMRIQIGVITSSIIKHVYYRNQP